MKKVLSIVLALAFSASAEITAVADIVGYEPFMRQVSAFTETARVPKLFRTINRASLDRLGLPALNGVDLARPVRCVVFKDGLQIETVGIVPVNGTDGIVAVQQMLADAYAERTEKGRWKVFSKPKNDLVRPETYVYFEKDTAVLAADFEDGEAVLTKGLQRVDVGDLPPNKLRVKLMPAVVAGYLDDDSGKNPVKPEDIASAEMELEVVPVAVNVLARIKPAEGSTFAERLAKRQVPTTMWRKIPRTSEFAAVTDGFGKPGFGESAVYVAVDPVDQRLCFVALRKIVDTQGVEADLAALAGGTSKSVINPVQLFGFAVKTAKHVTIEERRMWQFELEKQDDLIGRLPSFGLPFKPVQLMPKTDRMYAGIVQGMLVSATGGEKFFREVVSGLAVNEADFRARLDSSVETDRMVAAGVVSLTALVRQWVLAQPGGERLLEKLPLAGEGAVWSAGMQGPEQIFRLRLSGTEVGAIQNTIDKGMPVFQEIVMQLMVQQMMKKTNTESR